MGMGTQTMVERPYVLSIKKSIIDKILTVRYIVLKGIVTNKTEYGH